MPRRFKDAPDPQRARTDWKKEQEARQDRVAQHAQRAAVRRGGGIQNLMARRAGGPGPGGGGPGGGLEGMMRHPAVEFGRQMTGGVADGPRQAIMNQVLGRLAQRGLSRDATGTWQIAGLNRPTDPGLAIRNSAIAAMDPTGTILRRVLGADARLGEMAGGPTGMPSGMGGVPSPGLGAGSLPIGRANGMPLPPVTPGVRPPDLTRVPTPPGGGMQSAPPGLPGGPPMPPKSNVPGLGGPVPSPGLGGMPSPAAPKPPVSPPFPPQGQGVGRTTTPTGAEIDPTKYPRTDTGGINPTMVPGAQTRHTVPSMPTVPPGGGSPAGFPTLLPPGASTAKPAPPNPMPTAGVAGGINQAAPPIPPQSTMPPPSVANDIYRQPGTPPPSQVMPRGGSDYPVSNNSMPSIPPPPSGPPPTQRGDTPGWPQAQMQGYANPAGPLAQRLQQGRPGTPPSPGRAPTPTVAPGSMPGVSTPFNPAQMAQPAVKLPPIPRPTGFGTPGQTAVPQRQPANLANLGQSIQQTVASRIGAAQQGIRPGVSPATPGSPVGNSLDDLGDRIRAAVAGNTGNVQPAAPGGGVNNLGPATQSIMDRVRQQIAQAGVGQAQGGLPPMTSGTTPFPTQPGGGLNVPTAPGGPSTGTMPGAAPIPPGGVPSGMAAPSTSPAPAGGIGAPTGTINCQYGYGCGGDWSAVNSYDATFVAEGQKWGVDPAMLKAMAVIESGGQMIQGPAGAYGIMQIKGMNGDGSTWGNLADQLGYDLSTPEGQIGVAAAILGQYGQGSTPQERFLNSYYPTDCYTCPPPDQDNGITQEVYWNQMQGLIDTINGANPGAGTTPAAPGATPTGQLPPGANTPIQGGGPVAGEPGAMDPPAIPGSAVTPADTSLIPGMDVPINTTGRTGTTDVAMPTDPGSIPMQETPNFVLDNDPALRTQWGVNAEPVAQENPQTLSYLEALIPGESQAYLNSGSYGFKDDQGIAMYCKYWDWSCTAHTGLDLPTNGSQSFNSLTSGTVICAGAGSNPSPDTTRSGYSCNSYNDSEGGVGNITIQTADRAQITYGHSRSSNFNVGDTVNAGDALGMSGNNNGYHVHLEVRLPIAPDGGYVLVDPNVYFNNGYCNQGFCAY